MKRILLKPTFVILYCISFFSLLFAQDDRLLLPSSSSSSYNVDSIPILTCPVFNIEQMLFEDSLNAINGALPVRFAKDFEVEITPSTHGFWMEEDGFMIWRLKIKSENAYSINLIFENLFLPERASLFVYNEDLSYLAGPYTSTFNSGSGLLASPLIPGECIVVELIYDAGIIEVPVFTIRKINHDYWNVVGILIDGVPLDGFADKILECHNDINCPIGDDWQVEKHSVARIINDGKYLCSGALVNNTEANGRPFFLTANHCFEWGTNNDPDPNRGIFYFNYERPICVGGDGQWHHVLSGSEVRASNTISDFLLLELRARVPSSYQPFFSGWDRAGIDHDSGTAIHHPRGNVKKISTSSSTIYTNLEPVTIADLPEFAPHTLWEVFIDNGTLQMGSSGSPLFNENHKIIGQLTSGPPKSCPLPGGSLLFRSGRLNTSWLPGNNPEERLSDWLDPENTSITVMPGYAPQGWMHTWMNEWNAPKNENVHPSLKSLDVGSGVQLFYRGEDNKMHTFYWGNDDWHHAWVTGPNDPEVAKIEGDVVVGEGNQLFYRGQDGRIQTYYWWNNAWHHAHIGNGSASEMLSSSCGSLAVGGGNQLFYRGTDDQMHTYYWANNTWNHAYISEPNDPEVAKISGDVVVGEGNQLFYRGQDGRLQTYYWANNDWHHAHIGNDSNEKVSSACGAIHFGLGKVIYRGTDNLIHVFFWSGEDWEHAWLTSWYGNYGVEKVSGDISSISSDQIIYTGTDGRMHTYYYTNNDWVHDWLEASWQAPSIHNIGGSVVGAYNGQIFYRGFDGKCRIYYWEPSFVRAPNEYFTMNETPFSPTIPGVDYSNDILDFTLKPNPVSDELGIEVFAQNTDVVKIRIVNLMGRVVSEQDEMLQEGTNSARIFTDQLLPGLYFLSIVDSKGLRISKPFVKI